jgi:hypothetical protein
MAMKLLPDSFKKGQPKEHKTFETDSVADSLQG